MTVKRLDPSEQSACEAYEAFVSNHPHGDFMQSLCWAKVKSNWKNEAVVVYDANGQIKASMLILIKDLGVAGRTMFYSPRGPVLSMGDTASLDALLACAQTLAKEYNACMLRIDPCLEESASDETACLLNHGFLYRACAKERTTIQNRHNYVLPLSGKSEQDVLSSFRSKCRYNIRLSERKGVWCDYYGAEAVDSFHELMQITAERDGFEARGKDYYQRILESFGPRARIYLCHYENTPLCSAVAIQYAKKTSYLYGASSNDHRNLMPNHLMQWNMIQWAIAGGCHTYDFLGVPYYHDPSKREYGVYCFKKGFSGRVASYAGEFDYPYKKLETALLRKALSGSYQNSAVFKLLSGR